MMLTAQELLSLLQEPTVRRSVQQVLGLPSEPVAEALRELAAAQARTDASVKELAAAQARTEAAQTRTESSLLELRRAVGALSDNVGFGLEELAAIVLPGVLEREEGIRVERFSRRFLSPATGEEEVDLYAEGERGGRTVVVVGEVKSRIYEAEVRRFAAKAARLQPALPGDAVAVLFGFVIHPSARQAAQSLGVRVVASRPG
jgi:hypothetical protein